MEPEEYTIMENFFGETVQITMISPDEFIVCLDDDMRYFPSYERAYNWCYKHGFRE